MSWDISNNVLKMPALGRPFNMGTLYNARTEEIIPGFTLWSENDLNGVNTTRNKSKSFSLIASDKLTDKFQELDASGSVQISVLLGMVEPKGSAVYLMRKKRHFRETSIHVRCHYLSAVKEFTMEQLDEEKIRFVGIARSGNKETATHVVTKIQYGADATFTLTKRFEKDEDEQKASDELNQCADKLIKALNGSAMMVDAAGNLSGSNDVIDCHFATDFNLPDDVNIPTTFEQAMEFTRTFKQFAYDLILAAVDDDETHQPLGVPVTVWLHPLVSMPGCDRTSPALLYDEMSLTLTSQCVQILGNYEKVADELHSMLQDPLARRLSPFFKKLELVQQHLVELKMKLRKKVVNIRIGETQQKDSFAQLLSEMESELLLGNSNGLKRWLGQKHQELCIVRRFEDQAKDKIRNSKKVHFFPSARTLREQMTKVPIEISFEISFSFLARSESFLKSLNQKITEEKRNDSNQHGQHQLWYENKAVFERIEKEIVIFAEIVNAKSNDEKFAFAMTAPDEYDDICSTQFSIIVYNQQEKISGWKAVRNVCQHFPKERVIDLFRLLIEHYETRENLVDIIRLLVEPKIPEKWNPFPLLSLIRYYQEDNLIDIVRLMLIETNIDIHCKDNDGWNAFHTVCRYYRRNDLIYIFRLLIEKRIDVNCQTKFGNNALTLLCRHYRRNNLIDIVRLLIEKNIDVNCQTIDGWNALLLLCRYCKEDNLIDIVRLLIKNNINVNCKTSIGNGALNLLCQHYDKANLIDIVRLLIENCIDVNCKSQDGWNALLTVCRYYKQENLIDIVRLLIENNINFKCKSVYRCNALTLLCQHYHRENLIDIIQLLVIDEKVDVNCKDNDGWNALHYLCDTAPNTSGLADLVQLFIDHNINTNVGMTGFWYGKLIANLFSSNYVRATASSLLMKRFNENEVRDVLRILDRNPRFLSKLINRFLISTL